MAKVVEARGLKRMENRGQYTKYPWDRWTDGKARRLKRGKDFDRSIESVLSAARYQARRRGLTINYRVESETAIVLSFAKQPA